METVTTAKSVKETERGYNLRSRRNEKIENRKEKKGRGADKMENEREKEEGER